MANVGEMMVTISGDVAPLKKAMDQAGVVMNNAGKKIKAGSDTAGQSLMNLSRIAQDAPYGFMGIANNINPLLESFQRLKTESGSTGNALKSLGASMLGGGGLGLAVGVVSSLLVTFGSALFGAKKSTEEVTKANKEAANSFRSIVSSIAAESAQVEVLIAQLHKEGISRGQRKQAIEELQRIAPEYFNTLNSEKATISQITTAYHAYSRALLESVRLRAKESMLSDISVKILELEHKKRETATSQVDEYGRIINASNARYDDEITNETEYQKFLANRGLLTKQENAELKNLYVSQKKLVSEIANEKKLTEKKDNSPTKLPTPKAAETEVVLDQLRNQIQSSLKLKPLIPSILSAGNSDVKINQPQADFEQMIAEWIVLRSQMENTKALLTQGLTPAFDAFFNSITEGGSNAFASLGQALLQTVAQFGKAIAKAFIFAALTKLIMGPAAFAKAGGSLSLQSLLGGLGIPGFANGVQNFGGGVAMVGERGRELIRIPRGADVVPNRSLRMDAIGGGGQAMDVFVHAEIAGDKLLLVQDRALARRRRNG